MTDQAGAGIPGPRQDLARSGSKVSSRSMTDDASGSPSTGRRPVGRCCGSTARPGPDARCPRRLATAADELGVRIVALERPGVGASSPHAYDSIVD